MSQIFNSLPINEQIKHCAFLTCLVSELLFTQIPFRPRAREQNVSKPVVYRLADRNESLSVYSSLDREISGQRPYTLLWRLKDVFAIIEKHYLYGVFYIKSAFWKSMKMCTSLAMSHLRRTVSVLSSLLL